MTYSDVDEKLTRDEHLSREDRQLIEKVSRACGFKLKHIGCNTISNLLVYLLGPAIHITYEHPPPGTNIRDKRQTHILGSKQVVYLAALPFHPSPLYIRRTVRDGKADRFAPQVVYVELRQGNDKRSSPTLCYVSRRLLLPSNAPWEELSGATNTTEKLTAMLYAVTTPPPHCEKSVLARGVGIVHYGFMDASLIGYTPFIAIFEEGRLEKLALLDPLTLEPGIHMRNVTLYGFAGLDVKHYKIAGFAWVLLPLHSKLEIRVTHHIASSDDRDIIYMLAVFTIGAHLRRCYTDRYYNRYDRDHPGKDSLAEIVKVINVARSECSKLRLGYLVAQVEELYIKLFSSEPPRGSKERQLVDILLSAARVYGCRTTGEYLDCEPLYIPPPFLPDTTHYHVAYSVQRINTHRVVLERTLRYIRILKTLELKLMTAREHL